MPVPYYSFVRCLNVNVFLNAASMSDDLELCQLWIIFYVHGHFVLVKTLIQRNYAVSACHNVSSRSLCPITSKVQY